MGRTRICKGCALAGAGALVGAALALAIPPPPGAFAVVAALAFAAAVRATLAPRPSSVRPPKLATRGVPMLLGAWSAVASVRAGGAAAVGALVAGAALVAGIVAYRHRGPARAACEACPERAVTAVCAGFRPIARREAALRRLAARWLRAAGLAPGSAPRGGCS